MSTALAIASVTAVLKDLLNNGLIDHDVSASVGDVAVSALPPDLIDAAEDKKSRLNLFMYQVTPNAVWRNTGLPSRGGGDGERLNNPPLALDLHYLLTAYGAEEFHAEILLGYGMQLLHETPVLPRAAIRKSLAPPSIVIGGGALPPAMEALFTSELAEQVEQIKIIPQSQSAEELFRLWSAFGAKYRPTTVYQASVVLVESRRSVKSVPPVRERNVRVMPFRQPLVERVMAAGGVNEPILADSTLLILGQRLRGDVTRVVVSGIETGELQEASETQIGVRLSSLPDDLLQAGVRGVQVIHKLNFGTGADPHRGFESNVAAFVLRPRIETINVSNVEGSGNDPRSAEVNLSVKPAIGPTQRVVLLLNEITLPASPPGATPHAALAYSFNAPPRLDLQNPSGGLPPPPSENITIPISGVKAGTYLARVQVDGAQSPLGTDATNRYISPQLTIP